VVSKVCRRWDRHHIVVIYEHHRQGTCDALGATQ